MINEKLQKEWWKAIQYADIQSINALAKQNKELIDIKHDGLRETALEMSMTIIIDNLKSEEVVKTYVKIAKLLLRLDAKIDTSYCGGLPLLYLATLYKIEDLIPSILKRNVNLETTGYNDETALILAVRSNQKNIAELLLKKKANVNAIDRNGNTSLHFAVNYKHKEMVELLLQYGADQSIKNANQITPLRVAEAYHSILSICDEYDEIAEILKSHKPTKIPFEDLLSKTKQIKQQTDQKTSCDDGEMGNHN